MAFSLVQTTICFYIWDQKLLIIKPSKNHFTKVKNLEPYNGKNYIPKVDVLIRPLKF